MPAMDAPKSNQSGMPWWDLRTKAMSPLERGLEIAPQQQTKSILRRVGENHGDDGTEGPGSPGGAPSNMVCRGFVADFGKDDCQKLADLGFGQIGLEDQCPKLGDWRLPQISVADVTLGMSTLDFSPKSSVADPDLYMAEKSPFDALSFWDDSRDHSAIVPDLTTNTKLFPMKEMPGPEWQDPQIEGESGRAERGPLTAESPKEVPG